MTQKRVRVRVRLSPAARLQCSRAALIDRVCESIAGGAGLRGAGARENVKYATLKRWIDEDEDFLARYRRATAMRHKVFTDDVVAIADAAAGTTRSGARLRIAARKWFVAQAARAEARKEKEEKRKGAKPHGLTEEGIAMLEEALRRTKEASGAKAAWERDQARNGNQAEESWRDSHDEETEMERMPDDRRDDFWKDEPNDAEPEAPTPFVPRFFDDDDLRPPEPPYDPPRW